MKYLAIIPARKGSKEIPGKNVKPLKGKPMILWTIEQALKSKKISRVIVSTNCKKIAKLSKCAGAEVPFIRPEKYSTDTSSTESVLLHAVKELRIKKNESESSIVLLQPTSPIRLNNSIDKAISMFERDDADSLVSVNATKNFYWIKKNKKGFPLYNIHKRPTRQKFKKQDIIYKENGSIYITKLNTLIKKKNRLGGKITVYEMNGSEGLEVDSLEDFYNVNKEISKNNYFTNKIKTSDFQAIIFDFDGVLTDNNVYLSSKGVETVKCNRSDGHSFNLIKNLGLKIFILSSEINEVVKKRGQKLKVTTITGSKNKKKDLYKICKKYDLNLKKLIYVGNDINDLEAMTQCGISFAVNDAVSEIKQIADFVLMSKGGELVAREIFNDYLDK